MISSDADIKKFSIATIHSMEWWDIFQDVFALE